MPVTIDVGTTAVKVLQFDVAQQIIKQEKKEYETVYGDGGRAEQDPDVIVEAVFHCLKKLNLTNKETLILSGAMHSLMAVNQVFHKQTNVMIWADRRADEVIKTFKQTPQAMLFYKRTKTPIHPMSPFAKLLWLKETSSGQTLDQSLGDVMWIDLKTYLWYRLTNFCELDYSLASATGLFNSETLTYDQEILNFVGITKEQLPTLVPVTHTRHVTTAVKQRLGFDHQVMIGSSDGVLANISEGLHTNDVHVTIGTSGAIRMTVNKPYTDTDGRLFCYYLNDHHWVIGGAVNNGGNVLNWLDDLLFDGMGHIYSYIDRLDFSSFDPALIFIPHLNGERAPFWDTGRTGSFHGLKMSHNKAAIVKAVIYGVLFNLRHVFDTLQHVTGKIEAVYLSGGFFKVPQLKTLVSQVLNVSVIESTTLEQTSMGALRLLGEKKRNDKLKYQTITQPPSEALKFYYNSYRNCLRMVSSSQLTNNLSKH
ncbi:gluconokinase [Halolactibacillus halophilus]|uniref:Gluconate kinase n=1 Tax=Halolactibacillus halophilus TaxID=306540 RepID=A0A1I5S401_9BACI|nr:gluconokinase [Halolactibacillus halophilus]GEM02460.1 gluconate kinase [Halolactibacillus halophilus]SFP65006.1 gluconokinase [Halolactibacillus halophilus]